MFGRVYLIMWLLPILTLVVHTEGLAINKPLESEGILNYEEIVNSSISLEYNEDLFEGDIKLTEEQEEELRERKAVAPSSTNRWPLNAAGVPEVPYRFGDAIISRPLVHLAVERWQNLTCINFRNMTAGAEAIPHIVFITSTGCWSFIGRLQRNGQDIGMAPGCFNTIGTPMHEVGHALGLNHEQSRNDRDDHVRVETENIISGKENNFNKRETKNYETVYDYSSIMHYGSNGFSKNGKRTLVTKYLPAQIYIGQRGLPSFMDIKVVNEMYNCPAIWLKEHNKTVDPCQNGGFFFKDGSCKCPNGVNGTLCQQKNAEYRDTIEKTLNPYAQFITNDGAIITSPDFDQSYEKAREYTVNITAHSCQRINLTFTDFELKTQCVFHHLEIMTNPPTEGTKYCNMTAENQTFTSTGNQIALIYLNRYFIAYNVKGFRAVVRFINTPSCPATVTGATSTTSTTSTPTTSTPTTTTTSTPMTATTSTPTPTTTSTSTPTTTTASTPTTTTASTPTPTTTSTSTPTTTTSTPTTTIASTPTTTTTSTLTTTTSTTTTTTPNTPAPIPLMTSSNSTCKLIPTSDPTVYYLRNKNWPNNYVARENCYIRLSTAEPRYITADLTEVQTKPVDTMYFYYPPRILHRVVPLTIAEPNQVKLLGTYAYFRFYAGRRNIGTRFSIKLKVHANSCHKKIFLQSGESGNLTIENNYSDNTLCEWWIIAPRRQKVQFRISSFNIGDSSCLRGYAVYNSVGNLFSSRYNRFLCGQWGPVTYTSRRRVIKFMVNGWKGGFGGLTATYSAVP